MITADRHARRDRALRLGKMVVEIIDAARIVDAVIGCGTRIVVHIILRDLDRARAGQAAYMGAYVIEDLRVDIPVDVGLVVRAGADLGCGIQPGNTARSGGIIGDRPACGIV